MEFLYKLNFICGNRQTDRQTDRQTNFRLDCVVKTSRSATFGCLAAIIIMIILHHDDGDEEGINVRGINP